MIKEFVNKYKVAIGGAAGVLVIFGALIGFPKYNVYRRELKGIAMLKEATFTRQIAIEEANARLESAKLDKQTEVIKAQGIAESNEIINESLTREYLQYKFIETLNSETVQTIYVPTETGLPVLEASRKIK